MTVDGLPMLNMFVMITMQNNCFCNCWLRYEYVTSVLVRLSHWSF